MPRPLPCRICRAALEPAQEFVYHVECQTVGDPAALAAIRRLPHSAGRSLRVCRGCQGRLESRVRTVPARPVGNPLVLTVFAAVGVWAVTAALFRGGAS